MHAERYRHANSVCPRHDRSEVRMPTQPPFSFRKRSATPDFGLSEDGSEELIPCNEFPAPRAESGLSSIHTSIDSGERRPEESRDFIGLLQASEAGENSLRLSPVIQRKACSRLDESSIVDPSSHILVEDQGSSGLSREVLRLQEAFCEENTCFTQKLQVQSQAFEAQINSILTTFTSTQAKQENRLQRLRAEIRSIQQTDRNKENEGLLQALQRDMAQKETEQVEAANRTLREVKRDYEGRLQRQHEELRLLRQQNAQLKGKLESVTVEKESCEESEEEERQLKELKEENIRLKVRLGELKRVAGCPRCSVPSRTAKSCKS